MLMCGRCNKGNANDLAFCQFCGTRLTPEPLPACVSCGTRNPVGTNFCQGCGLRLQVTAGHAPTAPAEHAVRPEPARNAAPQRNPVPAATLTRPTSVATAGVILASPRPPAPEWPSPQPHARVAAPAAVIHARLVSVMRDGSDGPSYPLAGDQVDIGRSEGELLFDDPHLARRHARIAVHGADHVLTPLETRNGVYIQLQGQVEIQDGDHVLVGKQVLRFEVLPEAELNLRPAVEHGILLFGTPVKVPWARLRQITAAGTTRDVFHLCRPQVVLGREQGDILFSDDEFISRRHAQISQRGGRFLVEDLGSSNGTFIRLRGQHTLAAGEMLRMGDELLRFELG